MQLQKSGFVIISNEFFQVPYTFPSVGEFLVFVFASFHCDGNITASKKKDFTSKLAHDDGTVVTLFQRNDYQTIARKVAADI